MKILKIIHGYPPEYNAGSEVYSQSLCNEMVKRHEVVIFSREENEYIPDFQIREISTETGIPHFRVNMARSKDGYFHPLLNERFQNIVEKIKPDVAHIGHLSHLSTGVVDVLSGLKIPIIFTLHDYWLMCPRGQFLQRNFDGNNLFQLCGNQENNKCADNCYSMYYSGHNNVRDIEYWRHWISQRMSEMRRISEKIDIFHAPSKYLMNRFVNEFGLPIDKVFQLDYGFPIHYLRPVKKTLREDFVFGYIGTHIPAKGINILIEAFSKIKGKTSLKIYGRTNGQNTNALKMIADKCINPVSFEGEYVNYNLAERVFNNVDCIVVPSIWAENSPLVIHEAQACQIPVITADYGGMAEFVSHNINGLLFNHRDVESLSMQMQHAVENPEKMLQLGKHGYLYSSNGSVHSIEEHCLKIEEKYKSIVGHGK